MLPMQRLLVELTVLAKMLLKSLETKFIHEE